MLERGNFSFIVIAFGYPTSENSININKNIDIPSKPPFGKGRLSRFAPGARIVRVSQLRNTANAVKLYPTFSAPFCCQNAVDATLGKKWQRWIVLKRTAIVATFLLAEAGIRIFTTKKREGELKFSLPGNTPLNLYQPG